MSFSIDLVVADMHKKWMDKDGDELRITTIDGQRFTLETKGVFEANDERLVHIAVELLAALRPDLLMPLQFRYVPKGKKFRLPFDENEYIKLHRCNGSYNALNVTTGEAVVVAHWSDVEIL